MLHRYFVESWIPGALLWATLFLASQLITAANGRLYRAGAHGRFEWEGSPELQSALAAANLFRWRRIFSAIALVGIACCLAVVWFGARELSFGVSLYLAVLGSCTLPLCTTILRYANNYFVFRGALDGAIVGKVTFSEKYVRRSSAKGLLCFAGLYLLLAVVVGDWFCLGGVLGCALSAFRELERAQQLDQDSGEATGGSENSP